MAFGLSSLSKFFKRDTASSFGRAGAIGIDFGASSIKIVQLRDLRGIPTLLTYGELQLGPYEGIDIGRMTHLPAEKAAEALADILKEAGATGTRIAFTISYNSSFMSTMVIPTTDEEQIGAIVPVEARKYIPISLSKVSLDWVPLGPAAQASSTQVLVSAIYNEAMEWYESIIRTGSYSVAAREIEVFSAIRSVMSPKDDAVAILDLGASSTRLYIVKKGVVKKTHSIPLSGTEITASLAGELDIEFEKAEEKKRAFGLEGDPRDPRVQKVILSHTERGLREIHTVVKRYEETESDAVQKVILAGGGALLMGLPQYARDMFSLPVLIAEPFSKVAYPAFLQSTLKEGGAMFAVALGAALRAYKDV
jgi:type IV pilus assembly protein PilM